jgi:hypothetical protein
MDPEQQLREKRIQAQEKVANDLDTLKEAYNKVGKCVDQLENDEEWVRPRGKSDKLAVETFQLHCDYARTFMGLFPSYGPVLNDVLYNLKIELEQGTLKIRKLANLHDYNGAIFDSLRVFFHSSGAKAAMFDIDRDDFNTEIRKMRHKIY